MFAAYAFAISSRQANLPNIGLEVHVCGTPVVDLNADWVCPVVLNDSASGAFFELFESALHVAVICWLFDDPQRRRELCAATKMGNFRYFATARVSTIYVALYLHVVTLLGFLIRHHFLEFTDAVVPNVINCQLLPQFHNSHNG